MEKFLMYVCAILIAIICMLVKCDKDESETTPETYVHIVVDGKKHFAGRFENLDLQLGDKSISTNSSYLYNLSSRAIIVYEVAYSKFGKSPDSDGESMIVSPNEIVKLDKYRGNCIFFKNPPSSITTHSSSKEIEWRTFVDYY